MVQAHAHELLNQKNEGNERPLVSATGRLAQALDRLERNIRQLSASQARDVKQHEQLIAFERENAALKVERENLNGAIGQLEHQYSDLHKVASTIYNKLDDSIKRLTQIIED